MISDHSNKDIRPPANAQVLETSFFFLKCLIVIWESLSTSAKSI